jgi:hypothetical protein
MRYPCICRNSKCRARKSLPKKPGEYLRPPRCWNCGRADWKIDKYRLSENPKDRGHICGCTGRILIHRHGQKGCVHREEFQLDMVIAGRGGDKSNECLF